MSYSAWRRLLGGPLSLEQRRQNEICPRPDRRTLGSRLLEWAGCKRCRLPKQRCLLPPLEFSFLQPKVWDSEYQDLPGWMASREQKDGWVDVALISRPYGSSECGCRLTSILDVLHQTFPFRRHFGKRQPIGFPVPQRRRAGGILCGTDFLARTRPAARHRPGGYWQHTLACRK